MACNEKLAILLTKVDETQVAITLRNCSMQQCILHQMRSDEWCPQWLEEGRRINNNQEKHRKYKKNSRCSLKN